MPKRHRHHQHNKISPGISQSSCSPVSSQGKSRARPALPGRLPQVEEAAHFPDVTQASAEPNTGAIPRGHLKIEVDTGTSRLGGMGRLSDGFSHPASVSDNIPLHNKTLEKVASAEPVSFRGQSVGPSANSGYDPTTNVLFEMEVEARQEGAKEQTTNPDLTKTDSFINTTLIDYNMSHSHLITDKSYKISLVHIFPINTCSICLL